ncbi:hypothetical protein RMATCC62417_16582 [Rhizopus microsporus]|nr:hypothetical protein RMATCC62417_16582 [Rhizopus microsporus]
MKSGQGYNSSTGRSLMFLNAVDWTQPWIISIIVFHILCFITAICLRNHHNSISIYFFILLGFASLTQKLNSLGMKYWQSFSNTCYFEPSGVFIVSVYAAPLLVNAFVTMMLIIKAVVSLMVETKRRQLQQKIKKL